MLWGRYCEEPTTIPHPADPHARVGRRRARSKRGNPMRGRRRCVPPRRRHAGAGIREVRDQGSSFRTSFRVDTLAPPAPLAHRARQPARRKNPTRRGKAHAEPQGLPARREADLARSPPKYPTLRAALAPHPASQLPSQPRQSIANKFQLTMRRRHGRAPHPRAAAAGIFQNLGNGFGPHPGPPPSGGLRTPRPVKQ